MVPNEKEMTSTSGLVVVCGKFSGLFYYSRPSSWPSSCKKKRRFLSLVSHGRDSIRLSRYVSQSDYVVPLAAAACGAAAAFVGNVRMWYVMKYVRRKLSLSFPNGLSARARRMTIERAPRHISGPPEHRGTVGICPNHLLAANLTLF